MNAFKSFVKNVAEKAEKAEFASPIRRQSEASSYNGEQEYATGDDALEQGQVGGIKGQGYV